MTGPDAWTTGRAVLLAAWMASALLFSCRSQPPATAAAYYPLRPGTSLSYRIVVDATDALDQEDGPLEMKVETVGREDVAGLSVMRQKIERDGETYVVLIGVDDHGVFRHAIQSPGEEGPVIAPERFDFLHDPVQVGSSWPGRSAPSAIDIAGFFGPVDVVSTVAALGETVRTRAGEFRDTVRIEVAGRARVGEDEGSAAAVAAQGDGEDWDLSRGTFTLRETIWLARDVGMVKSVLVEGFAGDFDDRTVTVTTELQSTAR
jgi:hypothetical protein